MIFKLFQQERPYLAHSMNLASQVESRIETLDRLTCIHIIAEKGEGYIIIDSVIILAHSSSIHLCKVGILAFVTHK